MKDQRNHVICSYLFRVLPPLLDCLFPAPSESSLFASGNPWRAARTTDAQKSPHYGLTESTGTLTSLQRSLSKKTGAEAQCCCQHHLGWGRGRGSTKKQISPS